MTEEKEETIPYHWELDYPNGNVTIAICDCRDEELKRSWKFCPYCGRKIAWDKYEEEEL